MNKPIVHAGAACRSSVGQKAAKPLRCTEGQQTWIADERQLVAGWLAAIGISSRDWQRLTSHVIRPYGLSLTTVRDTSSTSSIVTAVTDTSGYVGQGTTHAHSHWVRPSGLRHEIPGSVGDRTLAGNTPPSLDKSGTASAVVWHPFVWLSDAVNQRLAMSVRD
ncbi:hypothetical protein MGG_16394 [Pyricularia oryzae 70-15]|uniref:Uncharacterized protein n=1 Tax=Pyricularia oryzae (strain 70-15 / ATCC MYA-4617 / FGSC 8958) TaxID=242507 RepID=G4MML9_PYRO7|nr:uncharacterized protein MGG_16394 [Pyricularia oryzae 70-15]EHA57791.1 hypothetical protein MGG_16394 [Pyricularia oryzae 70-15]